MWPFRSSRFAESWSQLEKALGDSNWSGREVNPLLSKLARATADASRAERLAVGERALRAIQSWGIQEAGLAALCSGTLVEYGNPPEPVFAAAMGRVPDVLRHARRFAALAQAAFPEQEQEEPPAEKGLMVGDLCVPWSWIRETGRTDREAVHSWNVLNDWCMAIVACATRSRPLRLQLARASLDDLPPVAALSGAAECLESLRLAPLSETFLFVDHGSGCVFELRVDGVCSNFEFHTLLAAALAKALGHQPPPRAVVECVTGRGPQQIEEPSRGQWNLYGWQAARPLARNEDVPQQLWVWNEGKPADVPLLDGRRVVVAGAPAYTRSWNTFRTFDKLAPRVDVVREMPAGEARAFVERLRSAPVSPG